MSLYDEQESPIERSWNPYGGAAVVEVNRANFMHSVYRHMALGLGVTGVVAMSVVRSPELLRGVMEHMMALAIVQLGVVIGLSALVNKINALTATALFYLYSALTGATLSILFLVYTRDSIASTFFVTAGTFGAMSAYGYLTKRDLSGVGHFLFMGLIGLVIASIVNIFVASSQLDWVLSCAGVLIFVGLSAYDTQRIKEMAYASEGEEDRSKLGIIGALMLYLDFINLFLYLLKFMGRRRD